MLRLKIVYEDGRHEIVDRPATSCLVDLAADLNAVEVEILYYYP